MALGDLMASRYSHSSPLVSSPLDHCSNHETEDSTVQTRDGDSGTSVNDFENTVTSMAYLPQTIVLREFRHDAFEVSVHSTQSVLVSKWRPVNRTKTWCVALVLCLNIKADPPDVIKISPCARIECWIDPFSMPPRRAIETIGETLSLQYERWQPKAKFKIELDPTVEEVKKLCTTCRKFAKTDRVLFHYNGHGVLKPTETGQIWLLNKTSGQPQNFTQYIPLHITDLDSWLLTPSIYVFDCSAAGMIVDAFLQLEEFRPSSSSESSSRDCILLAACEAHETLPLNDEFPGDVFTSCLTTPIRMALKWSRSRSLLHGSLADSFIDRIPGIQTDRRTPLGELNWIFTAVTDTIAWNVLPNDLFQRLFRQDLLVASLFRNFLLAERILRSANCSPISFPRLPPTHQHHMWDAWDMSAEICLAQLPTLLTDPSAEFQASTFFAEQLTAFEIWLDHGSERKKAPEQLPIVLQVLQGQSQRFRALVLLGRFLDMGPWAVQLALSVGIFPYVLKLLRSTNPEIRQILVFIWTKILAVDKSCQVDLVKDKGHIYFLRFLDSLEAYPEQRAMSAFILAVIVDGHKSGQAACLEAGIINICLKHLQGVSTTNDSPTEPLFLQCLSLCLGKLWEDFTQAQLIGLHTDALPIYGNLLTQPQPEVRASAIFALGTLLDVGCEVNRDDDEKVRTESSIIKSLLSVVSDGSPLVRAELAVALARFAFGHNKYLKSIAAAYWKPQSKSTLDSLPSFTIRTSDTNARRVSSSETFSFGDESSRRFDSRILDDSANTRLKPLDNSLYSQCVSAMYILAKDPSPHVAALGRRVLSIIGIEQTLPKSVNASLAHTPAKFRTPPVSPPRSTHLRRVCSLDFNSSVMTSKNSDSFLNSSQDQSFLPQSLVYNWTYAHFSKSLLTPPHDNEDIIARREDREKLSLDQIAKCRHSSVRKLHSQIPSWDTQFETSTRKALFQPFYPIAIAADEREQIRVWNYEKGSLLNCFNNHNHPDKGISKLCLVNELDDTDLLLVASSDGSVRVWKDYSVKGKQKLVTAFSSVQGHKPGVRSLNAVVDWQQTSGYMYASGEISSVMVWDLSNEQLVGSIPLASDSSISAMSASQIQGGQFAAGFADGSVKLFDTRTPDSHVFSTTQSYTQRVGKIVGIGFQPGLDPSKIVSASEFGGIKLFDVRHQKDAYSILSENKGPFTSLAVHRHTPIFASGSAKQTIDVFNMEGERLGSSNVRSNINCLTFHPYQGIGFGNSLFMLHHYTCTYWHRPLSVQE